jgi:hypothetical protein
MGIVFPGESAEYRGGPRSAVGAGDRAAPEAVAAARRELPPGGVVPEDYAFQRMAADGASTDVRLSELIAPGKDSLATALCSRATPVTSVRGQRVDRRRSWHLIRAHARHVWPFSISSRARRSTRASISINAR